MTFLQQTLAAAVLAAASVSHAQTSFPDKPITIVVPYSAGGTSDNQVRLIADPLSKILGQQIIVDNKPGASGALAASLVARAKPDGYTLIYPNNGFLIAAIVNKQAGYDPLKNFVPITTVTKVPMVLVVSKEVPPNNLRDFIKYVKGRPGQLNYASVGSGSFGNLATTLFAQSAGIKMTPIPYKGEAATTLAVRTNESQMLLTSPSSAMLGLAKEGAIKMLGVSTEKSSELVPGIQPIAEVLPGFSAEIWFGLLAPSGTPPEAVKKVNAAVQKVLQDTAIRARLFASGALAQHSTPADFERLLKVEHAQWTAIVQKNDIKGD
jgi:tripartite-type tricarboxylate transporter receptor subunit TctC